MHRQRRAGRSQPGEESDHHQVERGGVAEDEAADAAREWRPVGDVDLEVPPPLANEVIADVTPEALSRRLLERLPSALHGAHRDLDLVLGRLPRELLERLPVAIPALEVHSSIDPRGVTLQDLLDQADALEVLAPVERGGEAQARDGVAHRDMGRRIDGVLRVDRLLGGHPHGGQPLLDLRPEIGRLRTLIPKPGEELDHVGQARGSRPRHLRRALLARGPGFHIAEEHPGRNPRSAIGEGLVDEAANTIDERRLEHRRPRPELADGEGGNGLVGGDEPRQPIELEPPIAVLDEVERDGLDARDPGVLARGELRQLHIISARKIVENPDDLGFEQMKVVEEPLGRRHHRIAPAYVFGQRVIGGAESARVVGEAEEELGPVAAGRRGKGESTGQRSRSRFEAVDSEEGAAGRTTAVGAQGVGRVAGGGATCKAQVLDEG